MLASVCREQERIAKAEAARRETERILREQQAEVDAKKADMVKRDIQREKVTPLLLLYQPTQPPYSRATTPCVYLYYFYSCCEHYGYRLDERLSKRATHTL